MAVDCLGSVWPSPTQRYIAKQVPSRQTLVRKMF